MIRIGSRESRLAVIQSELVRDHIRSACPDMEAEIVTMKTTGDRILDRTLDQIGGKGLFVKELELALREGRSDICVHSLKDVPMEVPEDLPLLGVSQREDPRDVLVLPKGQTHPNPNLPLGCSSRRRILQFHRLFPQAIIRSIRGNVQTRLKKLDQGEYGGLILAAAGLKRLGLEHRITRYFTVDEIIPAAGQGILAVQGRAGESFPCLEDFFCKDAWYEAVCERAFVRTLDGGCSLPIAAHAQVKGTRLKLTGLYCDEAAGSYISGYMEGSVFDAEHMGKTLAVSLKEQIAAGGHALPL